MTPVACVFALVVMLSNTASVALPRGSVTIDRKHGFVNVEIPFVEEPQHALRDFDQLELTRMSVGEGLAGPLATVSE